MIEHGSFDAAAARLYVTPSAVRQRIEALADVGNGSSEGMRRPRIADGSFVRISEVHLDVPLFWQCWKRDSPMVEAVTAAVRSAARAQG